MNIMMILCLLMGFLLLNPNQVAAKELPPVWPCIIYGTVKENDKNVSNGIIVSAKMKGIEIASTEVIFYEGDSVYSMIIPGDSSMESDFIEFFIGNEQADQTGTWRSGKNTELYLTITNDKEYKIFLPLISH